MSWIGFASTAAIATGLGAGASIFDLTSNRFRHSRPWRFRRWLNWFSCGITYAGFYMGRYNMSVINNAETLSSIGITTEEYGQTISAGFWAYATAVLITSPFCDMLGGRRSYILGAVLSGSINLSFGIALYHGVRATQPLLTVFVILNYFAQAIATNVASKIPTPWYSKSERGTFGGVFGVMISCGYYLAFSVNGMLIDLEPGWPLVFIVPGCFILASSLLLVLVLRDEPPADCVVHPAPPSPNTATSGDDPSLVGQSSVKSAAVGGGADQDATIAAGLPTSVVPAGLADAGRTAALMRLDFKEMMQRLWTPDFVICCLVIGCAGFVRETLLSWFTPFLDDQYDIKPSSIWYTITGTGIMLFGSVGGLLCGYISDRFFEASRPPVIALFLGTAAVSLVLMYVIPSGPSASIFVGFSCLWVFGASQSLGFTIAMDIGGPKLAATASGFLGLFQYAGAGAGSLSMPTVMAKWGYLAWAVMLPAMATVALLLMGFLMVITRLSKRQQTEATVVPVVTDVENGDTGRKHPAQSKRTTEPDIQEPNTDEIQVISAE